MPHRCHGGMLVPEEKKDCPYCPVTAIEQAVVFCQNYIESAKALDPTNDDDVFNFLSAGIDILVERLRKAEKRAHAELRARFLITPPSVESDVTQDAP